MALSSFLSALSEGALIDLDVTFFVQLAIFWLTFAVLYVLIFKPMRALFEAREAAIYGARDEAKRLNAEADSNEGGFAEKLREVRNDAAKERDRLRQDGVLLEKQLIENVRKETQGTLEEGTKRLEEEARIVRGQISTTSITLARQIATKLLGREVQS